MFKGRHFETQTDYMNALRRAQGSALPKADEHSFTLRIVHGSMEVNVSGDPRVEADIDRLLEVLVTYARTWKEEA